MRPRSADITLVRINASSLSFVVPPPSEIGWKLSLESAPQITTPPKDMCDGFPAAVAHSLMIFCDPQTLAPDPGRSFSDIPGQLYFGPGLHDLNGQMPLPANVSGVYIAGGAWLSGGFITTGATSTVKISGRGVISGSIQPFLKDPAGFAPCSYNGSYCWSLVNLDKGSGHVLEGVVLHDPPKYYFRSYARGIAVRGVKMLGAWTYNTDGVVTGAAGQVTDSFIQSNDDSIKLFADGMVVTDCTVWQMNNGGVFQLGWWSSHDQSNITVERVTLIHAGWKLSPGGDWDATHAQNDAVFDLRGPGGGTPDPSKGGEYAVRNITWRDITIDSAVQGGGLVRLDLVNATGSIAGLRFERVSVPNAMGSSVAVDKAKAQDVSGLQFVDLKVGGVCVKDGNAAGFGSSGHAATFVCT